MNFITFVLESTALGLLTLGSLFFLFKWLKERHTK